ncbi:MAG TPA: alanine racemase [Terriglobales bacterium]
MTLTRGEEYRIADWEGIMTPALAIYADAVDHNISRMLAIVGDANRWRPHVKTAKLNYTIRRLVEHGVANMKCATTLELLTACEAGARDVTVAYPLPSPAVARVKEIAVAFPAVAVSALVENVDQVELWRGSPVGLFVDVNPGMNRTGIDARRIQDIVSIARKVIGAALRLRGVHFYDGHHTQTLLADRIKAAHLGYDRLMEIVGVLQGSGIFVEEVITSGTPSMPCALAYTGFSEQRFQHRVSPGTVIYNDSTSLSQLPRDYALKPAALVVSTVVSRPADDLVTCDAGHKTLSLDSGVPNCCVLEHDELQPLKPSEEHLPLRVQAGMSAPEIGARLYLLPKHVCPTVNNFDHALIVRGGRVVSIERVTARGREVPLRTVAARSR